MVPQEYALEALLHDAAEAYLGDVSTPLKLLLKEYKTIEKKVDAVIRKQYGLPLRASTEVKKADREILVLERSLLVFEDIPDTPSVIEEKILDTLQPQEAKKMFMDRFVELLWYVK